MPSVVPKKYNHVFVTIGIPAFNRGSKIGHAIESLLAQTHTHFELIISDDASTDETRTVCEEYARRDPRVVYSRHVENVGMKKNFEFLIEKARGEYCVWAGDDDAYHPQFIATLLTALIEHPEYGAAVSSIQFVDTHGKTQDGIFFEGRYDVTGFSPRELFRAAILKQPPVHFFTTGLFKTEIMRRFEPRYHGPGLDKILICELSFTVKLYSVPEVLQYKTIYPSGLYRYGSQLKKFYGRSRNWYFLLTLGKTLYTSSYITLLDKMFVLPSRLLWGAWVHRRGLLVEAFPFIKKIQHWTRVYIKNGAV